MSHAHGHGHHHGHDENDKRFPFHKMDRLDSPDRQARQPAAPLVEVLAEGTPGRILDIGVGTGYFALPLLERLPGARVTGLDIEPRMLGVVMGRALERGLFERVEAVEVPREDPESVPVEAGVYDAAFMVNFYHELDDRPAYLEKVRRAVRSGGRVIVCDWDPEAGAEHGPPLEIRVPAEKAIEELKAAGFPTVSRRETYPGFYTLVAE